MVAGCMVPHSPGGGGVTLGKEHTRLHQDVMALSHNLKATEQQANSLRAEVSQVRMATASLGTKVAQLLQAQGNRGDMDTL